MYLCIYIHIYAKQAKPLCFFPYVNETVYMYLCIYTYICETSETFVLDCPPVTCLTNKPSTLWTETRKHWSQKKLIHILVNNPLVWYDDWDIPLSFLPEYYWPSLVLIYELLCITSHYLISFSPRNSCVLDICLHWRRNSRILDICLHWRLQERNLTFQELRPNLMTNSGKFRQ